MAKRLLGKEVNEALVASLQTRAAALKEKGVTPTLAILRLGENPSTCPMRRALPSALRKSALLSRTSSCPSPLPRKKFWLSSTRSMLTTQSTAA